MYFCVNHPQTLCRELHQKSDAIDEERYDIAVKVGKNDKEVQIPKISDYVYFYYYYF